MEARRVSLKEVGTWSRPLSFCVLCQRPGDRRPAAGNKTLFRYVRRLGETQKETVRN